jgi:hypothetical protein
MLQTVPPYVDTLRRQGNLRRPFQTYQRHLCMLLCALHTDPYKSTKLQLS